MKIKSEHLIHIELSQREARWLYSVLQQNHQPQDIDDFYNDLQDKIMNGISKKLDNI